MKPRPVITRDARSTAPFEGIDAVIAGLLRARGIQTRNELDYSMGQLLPVGSLDNISAAVDLLLAHRDRAIIVVGDFDVDGATSTAVLLRCLARLGFDNVDYLVPNRFDFGYGLSVPIVDIARDRGASLIVTVDNGISSHDGVAHARELSIDVLVTDHHLPAETLPAANVILNPNLSGSRFGSRNLAGVGVAFYLMAALGRRLQEDGVSGAAKVALDVLDLVALGTVADVVPLDRNNRILVSQGIRRIRSGLVCAGIRALMQVAGRDLERLTAADLGFAVGPRLNAAGRLDDMSVGIECLLSDDEDIATQHAMALDQINRERRDIEQSMRAQALDYVERLGADRLPPCVCLFDAAWHQGIVGLVAGRVRERCHRPVIAFASENEGMLKGSMRSVPGVHARDLLEAVDGRHAGLIEKFGGHAMAAGLSLPRKSFDAFAAAVNEQMRARYAGADFSGALLVDGTLPPTHMNLAFARELRELGPWGAGFPEPQWLGDFRIVDRRVVGETHLKLSVEPVNGGQPIDAIAFGQSEADCRGVVRLTYRLDVNAWRGVERPQLVVEQIEAVTRSGQPPREDDATIARL